MRRPYKHAAAVADLRAHILDGTYQPGDELPSIAQIRATYGLGDRAARAAIRELVEQGLAVTRIGHGTYVRAGEATQADPTGHPAVPARARRTHAARRLAPTDAPTAGDEDLTPTTNTTTESPPPDVALMLDIDPAEAVTTERTILSDPAGPVALRTTYRRTPTTGTRATRTITTHTSARRPTPSEASTLATTTAAIVLIQDETHVDRNGHPIAVVRTVYRADTTRLADTYHPHT